MDLTVERIGSKTDITINICGYNEHNKLIKKEYHNHTTNEAIKDFKSSFGLRYKRNIKIRYKKVYNPKLVSLFYRKD